MKLILLALLAMASVAHGQTRWQLATGYRADSFHTQNIAAFASDVEQATNAALRIEVRVPQAEADVIRARFPGVLAITGPQQYDQVVAAVAEEGYKPRA